MAYVKTNWQTGDVITAEKLNNMEGGIESASPLYVDLTYDESTETYTPSVEFSVARTAFMAGVPVYVRYLTDEIHAKQFLVRMTELLNGDDDRMPSQMFGGSYHIVDTGNLHDYVIGGYAISWTSNVLNVKHVTGSAT